MGGRERKKEAERNGTQRTPQTKSGRRLVGGEIL